MIYVLTSGATYRVAMAGFSDRNRQVCQCRDVASGDLHWRISDEEPIATIGHIASDCSMVGHFNADSVMNAAAFDVGDRHCIGVM